MFQIPNGPKLKPLDFVQLCVVWTVDSMGVVTKASVSVYPAGVGNAVTSSPVTPDVLNRVNARMGLVFVLKAGMGDTALYVSTIYSIQTY